MYINIPQDGVDNMTMEILCATWRFIVVCDCLMEKRSLKVSMREVRDQWCIGVIRAVIVVVVVDGIRENSAAVDVYPSAIGVRIKLSVEFGVEVIDP